MIPVKNDGLYPQPSLCSTDAERLIICPSVWWSSLHQSSDVKRGQNLEAKANISGVEAKAEAKNNYEKVPSNDQQHTI